MTEVDQRARAPGIGEDICPECHGTSRVRGETCVNCGGTGKVIKGIASG